MTAIAVLLSCAENMTLRVTISVNLCHHKDHVPYFDVEMLSGALDTIQENLEWSTLASLVTQIQASYPNVTAQQVHATWSQMSKTLWKCN
jgi:hypothetical protein